MEFLSSQKRICGIWILIHFYFILFFLFNLKANLNFKIKIGFSDLIKINFPKFSRKCAELPLHRILGLNSSKLQRLSRAGPGVSVCPRLSRWELGSRGRWIPSPLTAAAICIGESSAVFLPRTLSFSLSPLSSARRTHRAMRQLRRSLEYVPISDD